MDADDYAPSRPVKANAISAALAPHEAHGPAQAQGSEQSQRNRPAEIEANTRHERDEAQRQTHTQNTGQGPDVPLHDPAFAVDARRAPQPPVQAVGAPGRPARPRP